MVNWWCLKFGFNEVKNLVMRHFEFAHVYTSCVLLTESCGLRKPKKHKNTAARPALEPCYNDLVKIMKDLVDAKEVPNIVIPASELGKIPLDTLSVSEERTVSSS